VYHVIIKIKRVYRTQKSNRKGSFVAEVIIIGAGLTGLSAAYHLESLGFFDYEIFEKEERAGGLARSESSNGFTFDYTGHFLHVNDDYFHTFLETVVGFDRFDKINRKSAIYSHDTFTEYPFQINLYGLPPAVIVECITEFVKKKKTKKTPENFYDWVLVHFGKGFGKHFFFPYQQKLFAYDIKKIHPSWTGRFVPQTDLSSLLHGALQPPSSSVGYNHCFYYPKTGGIEYVIKKLEQLISVPVVKNAAVIEIDTVNKIVYFSNGRQERYKFLINTMPLKNVLTMITGPNAVYRQQAAEKLLCNSVININMGCSSPITLDKHWLYFPEKKYSMYRLGFWHAISNSLVPEASQAVYGEISYLPEKTSMAERERKVALATHEIIRFLKISPNDVMFQKILLLEHAYVLYDAWFVKHRQALFAHLEQLDICSIGRYGGWKYSSMQEAVLDGRKAAQEYVSKKGIRQWSISNNSIKISRC
jgi:protoporphyrinogen oxidase